ncbi:hypothetical protein [Roseateles terrae]|uniref:Uncharacterized protein n=1 Tax=Roseateles terrae TaxID=431060 RepID=A0ABR6GSL9_9BURK|nr:hypothetical protein [Roseateles terrae]MBB3194716.1 hypothetical protein [Roseateles terrae]
MSLNTTSHALAEPEQVGRPPPPAGPQPPPSGIPWLSAHRQVAEAVLEDAKQHRRPAHPPVFEFGTLYGVDDCPALLRSQVTVRTALGPQHAERPAGRALQLLASPAPDVHSGWDLLRALRSLQVEALVTLGDLPVTWLPTSSPLNCAYAVNRPKEPTLLLETTATQCWGSGWSSKLSLRATAPMADGSLPALTLQRLHLPTQAVDLLPPDSLQSVLDWMTEHTPPGAPVALMAVNDIPTPHPASDPFPLRMMGNQVALAMALREGGETFGRDHALAQAQRQQLLADAASELHRHCPVPLVGTSHLSAVLEADHRSRSSRQGPRPPPARPVPPVRSALTHNADGG